MNHLVFLDTQAGELEKILSGVKTMLIKEFDLTHTSANPINSGDSLYFLKNNDDYTVRVKATVVRVLFLSNNKDEQPSHILKEMQSKLQLIEKQYNYWAAKEKVLLVEFESAHKISVIPVALEKIPNRSDWVAFDEFIQIT